MTQSVAVPRDLRTISFRCSLDSKCRVCLLLEIRLCGRIGIKRKLTAQCERVQNPYSGSPSVADEWLVILHRLPRHCFSLPLPLPLPQTLLQLPHPPSLLPPPILSSEPPPEAHTPNIPQLNRRCVRSGPRVQGNQEEKRCILADILHPPMYLLFPRAHLAHGAQLPSCPTTDANDGGCTLVYLTGARYPWSPSSSSP
ncbi:hypothetical protein BDZ97DRAFT_528605 [Flammula alnicola]|nr:hypothetical protein BDZ97DRAFT_528605 [Flammula alnicola]